MVFSSYPASIDGVEPLQCVQNNIAQGVEIMMG